MFDGHNSLKCGDFTCVKSLHVIASMFPFQTSRPVSISSSLVFDSREMELEASLSYLISMHPAIIMT